MASIFSLFGKIFLDNSEANKGIDETTNKTKKSASQMSKAFNIIKKAAVITGGAIAAGMTAVGVGASNADSAVRQFAASTNVSENALQGYKNVLNELYSENYGEDFKDLGEKMSIVYQQMGNISNVDMKNVMKNGYLLADVFGIDFTESLRGANAMMKQFGIDANTAYNLIAQGAKAGLNQNGDLADQLAEYSVYYSDLGYSAEEMMNIIASGAKSGAFQIDYLNDAMKEFGIRSKDGSEATKSAFRSLGLDAGSLTKAFAAGGESAKSAFTKVSNALLRVEDDVKRNELGVTLFGTKWEDLGESAVKAMLEADNAISASSDTLSKTAEEKYGGIENKIESVKRKIVTSFLPAFEKILPKVEKLIDKVVPFVDRLADFIPTIGAISAGILAVNGAIKLVNIATKAWTIAQTLLNAVMSANPFGIVVMAIIAVITAIGILWTKCEGFRNFFINLGEGIKAVFVGIAEWGKGLWVKFVSWLSELWSKAEEAGEKIKSFFKDPVNFVIELINSLIDKVNRFKINIPDWVPAIGGKEFGFDFSHIAKFRSGIDYVPYDEFPALLHKGEQVLTASEKKEYDAHLEGERREKESKKVNVSLTLKIENFINRSGEDINSLADNLIKIIYEKLREKEEVFA